MKLSMIIPAYNVEDYIDACLESVVTQDMPQDEYEIIVINDGSTDSTLEHINEFAKNHANIKVVNQDNQGQSVARNNGVKLSCGEYIWFVDGDDSICPNCLHGLLAVCDRMAPDMFCVGAPIGCIDVFPSDFSINTCVSNKYRGGEWVRLTKCWWAAWHYIIKRDFWVKNDLKFVAGIKYEDLECLTRAFYYAQKIYSLNNISCYRYRVREGSIMNSKVDKAKLMSNAIVAVSLSNFADKIKDDVFFVDYYRQNALSMYMDGLKAMSRDKKLMCHLKKYMQTVHKAKRLHVMERSVLKRVYQFIAIYLPRLYLKIC